ncbi:MAG: phospholipase D-like domain-containing protein [Aquabacterium sp.]|nr:phospholipase D-like domain-containing protein [Aquabacterium sp.]
MLALPHSVHWPLSALEHGAFVFFGLLTYVTSTRISKPHRHPSAAIAWVMSIALLPYVGIPLFLLFGVRKVPRAMSAPGHHLPANIDDDPAPWARNLLDALGMPEVTHNNSAVFHSDGRLALDTVLGLIGSAQSRVELCTFVLGNDAVGQAIVQALIQAAHRGVRVHVLLDAVGSWKLPAKVLKGLRKEGIAVRTFVPIWPNLRRGHVNLRNHRKLLIIDGERVWSGGRNLAGEYFVRADKHEAWTDISFIVQGPLAMQARHLFEQDWRAASGERRYAANHMPDVPSPDKGIAAQWIPSGPDHAEDTAYALLMAAAYRAENRIVLVSPYFVPDDALLNAWCMACRRGVSVTLVVPAKSNHRMADLARARSLRALIQAGGHVLLYPNMLHAKAVIIDDSLALCGSVNLDSRSLFLNYELSTAFYGQDEIDALSQWARTLITHGQLATAKAPSSARDLLEGLVRVIGFQL